MFFKKLSSLLSNIFLDDTSKLKNIQSTLYIGESRKKDFNEEVEKLNNSLKEFAKQNSIRFIDLNSIFAPKKVLKSDFTKDDLHLNGQAYKLWINEIKK